VPPGTAAQGGKPSLGLHGPGFLARCSLLELGVPRGAALVDRLAALLLDLLPVEAALGLAFRQHLCQGGSSHHQGQKEQEWGEPPRHGFAARE
jgi:hypothetical protein